MKINAIMAILALAGVASCGPSSAPAEKVGPERTYSSWTYYTGRDEMDGSITNTACISAIREVQADFPHKTAYPMLCMHQSKSGEQANVSMEGSGQVTCHDCRVRVKIDSAEPTATGADGSGNGSTEFLFFESDRQLITKIRGAKQFSVEIPLYNAASPVVMFDVSNLQWPIPEQPVTP